MSTYKYDVSLRVRHPELKANKICEELGLTPKIKWDVGAQRVTPKGRRLNGVYEETYCSFWLPHENDESLPEFLGKINEQLKSKVKFFDEIILSGGTAEYFIGWYLNENTGDVFNYKFLQEVSKLKISLSFDLYP